MSNLRTCPRCKERGYEVLKTHSYCVSCNYSPDLYAHSKKSPDDLPIPPWVMKAAEGVPTLTKEEVTALVPVGGAA